MLHNALHSIVSGQMKIVTKKSVTSMSDIAEFNVQDQFTSLLLR